MPRWRWLAMNSSCVAAPTFTASGTNNFIIMAENENLVGITSVSQEKRVFQPPKPFSKTAHFKSLAHYRKLYSESIRSPEKFWGKQAKNELVWFKQWKKVL